MLYKPAAKNPYSRCVTNGAGHAETPMAARRSRPTGCSACRA